jgi:DNA-binding SARP family transcriptional activator
MIFVRMLGPVQATVDGEPPPAELLWRKNLATLVYLARSPKRARTREHLAGLLWPEKPDAAARHSLNEALRVLRRAGGEAIIDSVSGQVRLAAGAVSLDVEEIERRVAAQDVAGAAALITGEFLEGFAVPGAGGFEDWLMAERGAWRARSIEVLLLHHRALLDAGRLAEAADAAARAEALDPLADSALRATMRCLALAGDRAGALARYDGFTERLREAVGIEPETDTDALAERVRRERIWRRPTPIPGHELREPPRRAPLLGRAAELAAIAGAWATCRRDSQATLALIVGDPGAGRSRLVDEVLTRARLDGAATALARGVPADRDEAGSATLALARGGLLDAPGAAAAPPAALAAFIARMPEWGDRFPGSRHVEEPMALGRALREVVRAVSDEQPTILALDDAHLVDGESLASLEAAARDLTGSPIFILLSATERADHPELEVVRARAGRDVAGMVVRLEPLSMPALRELAAWALGGWSDESLDRVTRRVAADSAGLPLLAVELVHAVAAGLALRETERTWPDPARTLDATLPGDLPDTVVAAIRTGFRLLSTDAQHVLAATAVLGGRATIPRLERATAEHGEPLVTALDELEWQRWLTSDERGYAFVARIVAEVVARDMVTPGQRRRILEAAGAG